MGYDKLIRDGVVDPDTWEKQERKILLILKEVNGKEVRDLRKFLYYGGRSDTWDMVVRWLVGLRHLKEDLTWEAVCGEAKLDTNRTLLRTIAAMNLKKTPGANTSNMKEIGDAAKLNSEYLRAQFDLYNPDIVITCGTHHQTWDVLHEKFVGGNWQYTTRGFRIARFIDASTMLFAATHPEARVPEPAIYYYLVDAVREAFEIKITSVLY